MVRLRNGSYLRSGNCELTVWSLPRLAVAVSNSALNKPILRSMIAAGGEMAKLSDDCVSELVVDIPPGFQDYLDGTLVRLQTLFPSFRFSKTEGAIMVIGPDSVTEDQLRRSILHTIYREKIYVETLGMRQALVEAVTAR